MHGYCFQTAELRTITLTRTTIHKQGLYNLCQATFTKKAEDRTLMAHGDFVIKFKRHLIINELPVYLHRLLSGKILYPVLILAEENLGMLIENCRVVNYESTLWIFSYDNREFFK